MGIFDWFRRESRAKPDIDGNGGKRQELWKNFGSEQNTIDEETALSLPAVFTCVSYISDKVSGFPVDVYRTGRDGVDKQVPTPAWLKQPNTTMTSFDFWNAINNSYLLHGNAFAIVIRNDKGAIIEMIPVHPGAVEVRTADSEVWYVIGGVPYKQGVDILHIKGFSLPGEVLGVSPIEAERRTITMGVNAEQFGADFYKYGLNLSGVIEMPKESKLDPDEAERMRKQFVAKHSGTTGSSAVGVLTGGAQWKQITLSPADAQFLESRKYSAVQIANIYHLPGFIVNPEATTTWGSGIAEQNQMIVTNALEPLTTRIEQAVTTFLLPGNQYMKMNMGALLKGDLKTQTEVLTKQLQYGLITPNEARRLLNQPEQPGGEDLQVYLNIASMQQEHEKGKLEIEKLRVELDILRKQLSTNAEEGGTT